MKPNVVVVFGDLHAPYHHRDALDFMSAIIDEYVPDEVVHIGDEVDWHSISFHPNDPELYSPSKEWEKAQYTMQTLQEIVPEMTVISSNHGNLPDRKLFDAGLPKGFLKSKNELYEVEDTWKHVLDYELDLATGEEVLFTHGMSANVVKTVQTFGKCVVQGHYHSKMGVQYCGIPGRMLWGLQTGCLIDWNSLAFAYGRANLAKPLLGSAVIIDGVPTPLPMHLKKNGRWKGEL